jgi:hypothetical protein
MKRIKSITGVASVYKFEKQLCYCFINGQLCLNNTTIAMDVEAQSYWLRNNILYYHNKDGKHCFIDLLNDKETKGDFGIAWFSINNGLAISSYDVKKNDGKWSWKTGLLDINQQAIIRLLPKLENKSIAFSLNNNDIVVYNSMYSLSKYSLLTDDYLWECNLPIYRIVNLIGEYSNKLILIYENAQNLKGTLALDMQRGKIVWNTEGGDFLSTFSKNGNTIIHLQSGDLSLNGIQVVKRANIFKEIDLNTGKVKREGVLIDLDEAGLSIKTFIVEDDYIYFTANYQGSFGAIVIGILDYENLNLLWWHIVEMQDADGFGNFLMNKPVFSDNKFYVLDKTGVLHIFEQEVDVFLTKASQGGLMPFEYLPPPQSKPHIPNDDSLPF